MYIRTVSFAPDVDSAMLPAHLAKCLRGLEARNVEIEPNRVSFTGGVFRPVTNWNDLISFGSGDLTVDPSTGNVTYRLSLRQIAIGAIVPVGIFGAFMWFEIRSWHKFVFLPLIWIFLVGVNLASELPRFNRFLRRALETAPRIKR